MSSGSRGGPPLGRYGSDNDYGKRRKNFYASSTRRDFKSSAAPSTTNNQSASSNSYSSSHSKSLLRGDKSQSYDASTRPRYRDVSGNSPNLASSRANSYSKESRYGNNGSYPKHYSSFQQGHYIDRSASYGSFSSKRETDNYIGYSGPSRESTSRDIVNSSSQRSDGLFVRDSWRGERPKLSSSGSSKSFSSPSRFNPNSIPVNARSTLNGLMDTATKEDTKDRYDTYDESYSSRWKLSYPSSRPEKQNYSPAFSSGSNRFMSKDRGRSSALTNSIGTSSRNDSFYLKHYNGGRYVDRYSRSPSEGIDKSTDNELRRPRESINADSDRSMDHSRDDETYGDDFNPIDYEESNHDENQDEEEDDDQLATNDNLDVETEPSKSTNGDIKDKATLNVTEKEEFSYHTPTTVRVEVLVPVDLSNYVDYPEGCIYPLTQLEAQYAELKEEYHNIKQREESEKSQVSLTPQKIFKDITEYSSYRDNLWEFSNTMKERINDIQIENLKTKKKRLSLWLQYEKMRTDNERKRKDLDEQLKVIHPPDDESKRELAAIDIRVKQQEPVSQLPSVDTPPHTSRRGRRHGDLVTTEAEFQEILKSLEKEQDESPMAKAKRVSAKIPDLILDPIEASNTKFMDSNNIVHDKEAWALRIKYDFVDNFSEKEHELFCEAFCRSPKRFGEIARYMGGFRSAEECVVHYYMTKKSVNYKFLVSQFKKKASRKTSRRKSSKAKALVTPLSEMEGNMHDPKSMTAHEEPEGSLKEIENTEQKKRQASPVVHDEAISSDVVEEHARKKSRKGKVSETGPPELARPVVDNYPKVVQISQPEVISHDHSKEQTNKDTHLSGVGDPNAYTQTPTRHEVLTFSSDSTDNDSRKHNSSYWSITEVNEFPHLLNTYGSKWTSIAEKLATKTATMVRNYYQRNAEKNGWNELVAAADMRLGHNPTDDGRKISSVDATIVVKPQRTTSGENFVNGTEYNTRLETQQSIGGKLDSTVQMGTFQHPMQLGLSTSGIENTAAKILDRNVTTKNEALELHQNISSRAGEGQKPSIMSLLNNDTTPVKPTSSGTQFIPLRANNLSALLNAHSSPTAPKDERVADRRNSIKSLLQD